MKATPLGDNAFPLPDGANSAGSRGMSLRDYFAGQVIAAALTEIQSLPDETPEESLARGAKTAYLVADAMLAEREKGGAR